MLSEPQLPLLPLLLDQVPPGLEQVLGQEGVPTCPRLAGTSAGRFVLFDSRRTACPPLRPGQQAIDVDRLRHGFKEDPLWALEDERSQRHQWRIAGRTISEEIARVDRRALRQQIVERLRVEVERAGGIWLRVAAFPFPCRSALNFRIDHDRFDPKDFDAALEATEGNEHAVSHFVSGAVCRAQPGALARLAGLDVGSHGYRHHVYLSEEENLTNVRRGIEALQGLGIEPSGFVAPHGRFNRGLLAAIERLRIGHSSEFGLAYDDLPFFPGRGNVLQIPGHPVCLGLFLESAGAASGAARDAETQAAQAAVEYFRDALRSRYRAGEPAFFYGHPTGRLGRYPELLRTVFQEADTFSSLWKTTLSGFAAWWRVRAELRLSVVRGGDEFVVTAGRRPAGYPFAVEYCRRRHVARMPLSGRVLRFSPGALAYENRTPEAGVRPVRIDRPEGLRSRIGRWIDWERETPIEEIDGGTWRNWSKRTLRRLYK